MKVGDLVKVHPACVGYYIILAQLGGCFADGFQLWRICGVYESANEYGCGVSIDMSEKWMELISESR